MAFSNSFNGDVKSLNYILQTLEAKELLIPGVISNANLQVSAGGEVAYFYKRGATTVAGGGSLGSQINYTSSGVTREDINLVNAIQIGAVLPHVNYATVTAEVIADKVIQETLTATNKWNELGANFIETNAKNYYKTADGTIVVVDGTVVTTPPTNAALTAATIYAEIVDMRKAFNLKNKAKGMKPTGILVSEAAYALLLKSPEFIKKEQNDMAVVSEGYVGRVAGLNVVVSPDITADIIMVNAEGFGAPMNVKSLVVADATAAGYPGGVIVAGELGYGFKITDEDLVLVR